MEGLTLSTSDMFSRPEMSCCCCERTAVCSITAEGESHQDIIRAVASQIQSERQQPCLCWVHAFPLQKVAPEKVMLRLLWYISGEKGGAWQMNSCSEWLYLEVIFSARLSLTLKMEEARDIFHPKLNGKWQVSDFCIFLSLNSQAFADGDSKAPTWKSSKWNSCN